MSIKESAEKIKNWFNFEAVLGNKKAVYDWYLIAVIILVALSSFGLGRLSLIDEKRVPVKIEYGEQPAGEQETAKLAPSDNKDSGTAAGGNAGKVIAAKNGTKYYLPWCTGADRISEKNKVWFNSVAEAARAGYAPAANCKGL